MSNEIEVMYCNTKNMIADIMAKALPKPSFEKLRNLLGVFAVWTVKHFEIEQVELYYCLACNHQVGVLD